jgi:biofilm PGA synthesis lipoprotein PgaB
MFDATPPAMFEPSQPRPIRLVRILRMLTGALSMVALVAAGVSWVALSRPFDPPQLRAMTSASKAAPIPTYPGAITVLTYHAVSDRDHSSSTLTRQVFADHMALLVAAGYHTVRLTDVQAMMAHESVQLPPRPLLLTFDDGAITDWTVVDPVLRKYGFTATAFLTTGRIVEPGRPSFYLSTRQVQAMRESGRWEFGAHTHALHDQANVLGDIAPAMTNRILIAADEPETMDQWRARVRADLEQSQRFFQTELGAPATAFAYPYGESGDEPHGGSNTTEIADDLPILLEEAGFTVAFVGENVPTGHVDAITASSPRWLLPRIGVRATTSVDDLRRMIIRSVPIAPPSDLTTLPWIGDLASCVTAPGASVSLAVAAGGYGNCGLGDVNTSQWRDYRLTTRLVGVDRRTTAIVSVRDGAGAGHHGRVEVVVGESTMTVRQQIGDGPREVLGAVPITAAPAGSDLLIEVRGDLVTVQFADTPPITVPFDPRLHEGGVLFSAASEPGRAVTFAAPTLSPITT